MGLYNVAGKAETHARIMNQTWKNWLEQGENVVFVSSEGTRIFFRKNIILLYSNMFAKILSDIPPAGSDIFISLQLSEKLIKDLVMILIEGKASVANKRELAEIKAAGRMIGVALDDLNIESLAETVIPANNIKKEVIDDDLFPVHSEGKVKATKPKQKSTPATATPKTKKSQQVVAARVASAKKTVLSKIPSKTVPAEMLLKEDSSVPIPAAVKIKKEVVDQVVAPKLGKGKKNPQVTFSDEFANFARKKLTKMSNNDTPVNPSNSVHTKSLLLKPRIKQSTHAANLQRPSNKSKSLELELKKKLELKKMTGIRRNNVKENSLGKNIASEPKFKPVEITDTRGKLVSSKNMANDLKKDASKLRVNPSMKEKNTKVKSVVKNSSENTLTKNVKNKIKQEKNVDKTIKPDKRNAVKQKKTPQRGQVKHKIIKTEKVEFDDTKSVASTEDDVAIEYEETEETKCPYCYKEFSEFKRLSSHMMVKHKNEV